jgi:hypothetical protein
MDVNAVLALATLFSPFVSAGLGAYVTVKVIETKLAYIERDIARAHKRLDSLQ